MKRFHLAADRAAAASLFLIFAANLLFAAAFLIVTALAAGEAHAEAAACAGEDMRAVLAAEDPARMKDVLAQAAATPNGEGLLWRVEKPGAEPSWLFGTMHMTDPRVVELTPAAQDAFEAAETLVIETTDILDRSRMMAAMLEHPGLTMFTDDRTLSSLIPQDERDDVEAALSARGISLASVDKMTPWMLSAMVSLPACEMQRKAGGAPVLDVKLARDAKAAGKSVAGLETVIDQFSAMASLPMEFHIEGLVETLKLGPRMDDVVETMIVLYEEERTGMFWPLFRAVLPHGHDGDTGFAAFEEAMVTARNRNMAENAAPLLAEGGAFVAVGALHLPGETGLIELLRAEGYTVERVR